MAFSFKVKITKNKEYIEVINWSWAIRMKFLFACDNVCLSYLYFSEIFVHLKKAGLRIRTFYPVSGSSSSVQNNETVFDFIRPALKIVVEKYRKYLLKPFSIPNLFPVLRIRIRPKIIENSILRKLLRFLRLFFYRTHLKKSLIRIFFVWINIFNIYIVVKHFLDNQKNKSYKTAFIFSILGRIRIRFSTKWIATLLIFQIRNISFRLK